MVDVSFALPANLNLAIVGGGPHALTRVTHLLQKEKSMRGRFIVFDPSGMWSASGIIHLRR